MRGGLQHYVLDYHPFDVVGWDGYVYPYTFNIHDFEPRTGRLHLPPPVHQTFQGPNFVICSFCPRELDYDPQAIADPLPPLEPAVRGGHLLRRRASSAAARASRSARSRCTRPACRTGRSRASSRSRSAMRRTEELAVMWDTFKPLRLTELAAQIDQPEYAYSWRDAEPSPVAESTTG